MSHAQWWDVPAVPAFRNGARDFLTAVDARTQLTGVELLHRVHTILPRLYALALSLPQKPANAFEEPGQDYTPPTSDPAALERRHAQWQTIFGQLQHCLAAEWEHYQEMFDPYSLQDERPVVGSLSDDLADIYMDLSSGERLWLAGTYDEAVWEWRFHFESHWSEHLTGALRAIRTLAAVKDVDFPPTSPA